MDKKKIQNLIAQANAGEPFPSRLVIPQIYGEEESKLILKLIELLPHTNVTALDTHNLSDEAILTLAEILPLSNLIELNMGDQNPSVNKASAEALSRGLEHSRVERLTIPPLKKGVALKLATGSGRSSLKDVSLGNCKDSDCAEIINALPSTINSLDISVVGKRSLDVLGKWLPSSALHNLKISNISEDATLKDLQILAEGIAQSPLQHLAITVRFGSRRHPIVEAIAPVLAKSQLRSLNLDYYDCNLDLLGKYLSGSQLTSLLLDQSHFKDIRPVSKALPNSEITTLDVHAINNRSIESLMQVLPYSKLKNLRCIGNEHPCDHSEDFLALLPYSHLTQLEGSPFDLEGTTGQAKHEFEQELQSILADNLAREERGELPPPLPRWLAEKYPPPPDWVGPREPSTRQPTTRIDVPRHEGKTLEQRIKDWEQGI